ncbi:MAG: hypothetical protein RIC55_00150 [Pirellulaceae bacterium]
MPHVRQGRDSQARLDHVIRQLDADLAWIAQASYNKMPVELSATR